MRDWSCLIHIFLKIVTFIRMQYMTKTNLKADECLDISKFDITLIKAINLVHFITPKNAFYLNEYKECKFLLVQKLGWLLPIFSCILKFSWVVAGWMFNATVIFRGKVVFWPKDNYSEGCSFEIKFSAHPNDIGSTLTLIALFHLWIKLFMTITSCLVASNKQQSNWKEVKSGKLWNLQLISEWRLI